MSDINTIRKYDKIAEDLKRLIKRKEFPGAKLYGERLIAKKYKVHPITASKAIKSLEKEGYVYRIPGKGTFIKASKNLSKALEIYLLAFYVIKENKYLNNILKIFEPPYLCEGFNIFKRIISTVEDREDIWNIELKRIASLKDLDVVLLLSASLQYSEIEECLNLPNPVIFIGDFKDGRFDDLKFNQISGDNSRTAQFCVEYLIQNGHREIALFSGSLEHFFNREFLKGAKQATDFHGAELTVFEFPAKLSRISSKQRNKTIVKILSSFLAEKESHDALLISGIAPDYIMPLLQEKQVNIPKEFSVLCSSDDAKDINCLQYDYAFLQETITTRIKELVDGDKKLKKQSVDWPVSIIDNGTVLNRKK